MAVAFKFPKKAANPFIIVFEKGFAPVLGFSIFSTGDRFSIKRMIVQIQIGHTTIMLDFRTLFN